MYINFFFSFFVIQDFYTHESRIFNKSYKRLEKIKKRTAHTLSDSTSFESRVRKRVWQHKKKSVYLYICHV